MSWLKTLTNEMIAKLSLHADSSVADPPVSWRSPSGHPSEALAELSAATRKSVQDRRRHAQAGGIARRLPGTRPAKGGVSWPPSRLPTAYLPRRPTETVLYGLVRQHLEPFLAYAREHGRSVPAESAAASPRCPQGAQVPSK
jgi:hypothetical protein